MPYKVFNRYDSARIVFEGADLRGANFSDSDINEYCATTAASKLKDI